MTRTPWLLLPALLLPALPLATDCLHGGSGHVEFLGLCHASAHAGEDGDEDPAWDSAVSHAQLPDAGLSRPTRGPDPEPELSSSVAPSAPLHSPRAFLSAEPARNRDPTGPPAYVRNSSLRL